ncbi:MAG: phosphatidylglycerol lysyltransferase domain-containing protein [Phycisphaerales bacterium]
MPDAASPTRDHPDGPARAPSLPDAREAAGILSQPRAPRDRSALLHTLKIAARVILLAAIGWLVWHELRQIDLPAAARRLSGSEPRSVAMAAGAAVLALLMMGFYDVIAFPSTPQLRARARWAMGTLFFAWTNFLTLGPIGGPALRLFVYRGRGLSAAEVVRGMLRIYSGTLGGISAWTVAALLPMGDTPADSAKRIATALLIAPLLTMLFVRLLRRWRSSSGVDLGDAGAAGLGLLGALDWGVAIIVFILCGRAIGYAAEPSISGFIRAITFGQVVGYVSMIPGGLGSADAVWIKVLSTYGVDPSNAAAHILLFRLVYYLMPWTVSLMILYARFAGSSEPLLRWQRRLLAAAVGVNALILLASAATPALASRMRLIEQYVALDTVEASHAVAVVAAVVMLFLVRGILRGYRAAFIVTALTLGASVVAHLIKGGGFEEAAVSLLLLALLMGSRNGFTRRGRVPVGFELGLGVTAGALAFFTLISLGAFPRIRASGLYEVYERAMADPETARVIRGAWIIGAVGLIFLLRQALAPRRQAVVPTGAEVAEAQAFIAGRWGPAPALPVAAGDKGVWLWRPHRRTEGVVLYQRRHRKLVALGEPAVGEGRASDLLVDLHGFARDEGLEVVFYGVGDAWERPLRELGYTLFPLAEELVLPLAAGARPGATEEPGAAGGDPVTYNILTPPVDRALIEELRPVSDAWLGAAGITEMQFAVGAFAPAVLANQPLGVARDAHGRPLAFASLLAPGAGGALPAGGGDAAVWLLRWAPGASDAAAALVEHLARSAAADGYARLSLGLTPWPALGRHLTAGVPARHAALLFEHAHRIYGPLGRGQVADALAAAGLTVEHEPRFIAYRRPWDWTGAILSATSLIMARAPEDRRRIEAARA